MKYIPFHDTSLHTQYTVSFHPPPEQDIKIITNYNLISDMNSIQHNQSIETFLHST